VARDLSIKKAIPNIVLPVGSVAEVEALGFDGKDFKNIATCSAPSKENRGCHMYSSCDREWRGDRPRYQSYDEIKPSGEMRSGCGACHFVVARELAAEPNGGFVRVTGGEGHEFMAVGSERLHPKPEPGCIACREGKCSTYVDCEFKQTVPAFPPAAEHPSLRRFARVIEAKSARASASLTNRKRVLLRDDDGESKAR
jgi:hypothetical protein